MQFQEKMIPHIRKYNMKCLTHLVSCNLITNSINRNLFEETLKLAKENMEKCTSFTFSR